MSYAETGCSSEPSPERSECLLDGARGIYLPQSFVRCYDAASWHVKPDDAEILEAGPYHEFYWDAWNDVLNYAYYDDGRGHWTLEQDGDLFAVVYV